MDDGVSYEHITAEIQKLDKMTANELKEVAKQFGVATGKDQESLARRHPGQDHAPENNARAYPVLARSRMTGPGALAS